MEHHLGTASANELDMADSINYIQAQCAPPMEHKIRRQGWQAIMFHFLDSALRSLDPTESVEIGSNHVELFWVLWRLSICRNGSGRDIWNLRKP